MMSPSRAGRRRPSEINLPQKSPTKIEPWTPRRRRPRKACVDRPFVRACFYILALSVWPTCIYLQNTRWSEEWDATARIERGDLREHETFPALDPVHEFSRAAPSADERDAHGHVIPADCHAWFDGCNTCTAMEPGYHSCTRKLCDALGAARCLDDAQPPPGAAAPWRDVLGERNGFSMERDEQTGFFVPTFWEPPAGADELDHVETIDGEPTIFLMIASYRDWQCRDTAASALSRATHPGRVTVAVVQQNRPGDVACAEPPTPCAEDPDQPLCKYSSQIKVYAMDANEATGPVYARHVGYRMYRGEAFAMQVDAHCVFVNGWDVGIIDQWKRTKNEMAVLSTYLTDVQGSISPTGDSLRKTRPIMCNSDFEGSPSYLRHGAQPELVPAIRDVPMLQPYWAAGFSFARGHFVHRVRYDCCLPMVFMGEEISIGIRAWTHGYDLYAPQASVLFHEYAQHNSRRHNVPKFWEQTKHRGDGRRSLQRLTALIGMAPPGMSNDWDRTKASEYGLGTARPVDLFYKMVLVDVAKRSAVPLCQFVHTGDMHRMLHDAHLRADGRGIDYSGVAQDLDVMKVIDRRLYDPIVAQLKRAVASGRGAAAALAEARRTKLTKHHPELAQLVEDVRRIH